MDCWVWFYSPNLYDWQVMRQWTSITRENNKTILCSELLESSVLWLVRLVCRTYRLQIMWTLFAETLRDANFRLKEVFVQYSKYAVSKKKILSVPEAFETFWLLNLHLYFFFLQFLVGESELIIWLCLCVCVVSPGWMWCSNRSERKDNCTVTISVYSTSVHTAVCTT